MTQLSTIRGNVRRNLGETTANFYTDAELNQFIGEAYRHYSLIMIKEGDGYFETTTNLGFTSGTETVSLSSLSPSFFKISQLYRRVSSYGLVPMNPAQNRFKAQNLIGAAAGDGYVPDYKLRGLNLVLQPPPASTESGSSTTGIKLDYYFIPTFPSSGSSDSFDFDTTNSCSTSYYDPMFELYATIAALEAKDAMGGVSDTSSFRDRLSKWEAEFTDNLNRDETPESVEYMGEDYSGI